MGRRKTLEAQSGVREPERDGGWEWGGARVVRAHGRAGCPQRREASRQGGSLGREAVRENGHTQGHCPEK